MFYTFTQNNSWWHLVFDKEKWLWAFVVIEALDEEEALEKAEDIWIYFDWVLNEIDCECCWDRWSQYPDEYNKPLIYWKDFNLYDWGDNTIYNTVFVHYIDWSIEFKNQDNLIIKIK